ncbi:hypothetical protein Tco_0693371 [Tanacetum coccineum]
MKSRKRRYIQNTSEDDSDKENDELRLHLTIAQDEEKEVDYEILDRKFPIKEWKTVCLGTKPQPDQAEPLEEINLNVLEVAHSSGVHIALNTEEGIVIQCFVEKKYLPLKKEIVVQMLKLKLESEEESTMALELIRFIKKAKELASHKQTLRIEIVHDEELSIPEQTATGKGTSNPLMAGCLLRLPMVCSFVAKLKSNGVGFDGGLFFVTAIGDEPGYCRFDVGLHEAMMSLGVRKLKDEVICTLAHQLTEVAAMADVLRFATLLSLIYVGVLSLPAQRSLIENAAKQRRRQHVVSVVKERREATFRTKRLCRDGVSIDMDVVSYGGMLIEEEPSVLDAQMGSAVEELKLAVSFEGNDELLEAARCLTNIAGGKSKEIRAFLLTLPLLIAHLGGKRLEGLRSSSSRRRQLAAICISSDSRQYHQVSKETTTKIMTIPPLIKGKEAPQRGHIGSSLKCLF